MTLVFCSYRLDKKRTEEEEDVQIYYSAKNVGPVLQTGEDKLISLSVHSGANQTTH